MLPLIYRNFLEEDARQFSLLHIKQTKEDPVAEHCRSCVTAFLILGKWNV